MVPAKPAYDITTGTWLEIFVINFNFFHTKRAVIIFLV
jgi:thiamine phosphate synthase YjbQ (UPF0047 family)